MSRNAPLPSVLATGFFWAWLLMWYTNAGDRAWPIDSPSMFLVVRLPVIVSCMLGTFFIAFLVARGHVLGTKLTVALGAASMAAGQAIVMLASGSDGSARSLWLAVGSFFAFAGSAALLPMWNADYNSGDVLRRGATVLAAALMGVGLFQIACALPHNWAIVATLALPICSAVVLVSSHDTPPSLIAAPASPTNAPADLRTVGASIGLGLLSGVTLGFDLLEYHPSTPTPQTRIIFLIAGLAGLALAVWTLRTLRNLERARPILPLLPMVVLGLLILPFFSEGARTMTQLAVGAAVLCWAMILALGPTDNVYQLTLGTRVMEVREQVVNMAIGTNGAVIGYLLGVLLTSNSTFLRVLVVVVAYAVSLWTAALVSLRVGRSSEARPLGKREACNRIGNEYGLTERELEIMLLLAEGRNLPYVQQKLSIAHGTAATHVTHIYQKLGIHDRQELLTLISECGEGNGERE